MSYDVIIAGGGIGGSTLATLLGRAGRRVLVLEKSLGPPKLIRPELLWPQTAKLLRELLGDRVFSEITLPLQGINVSRGGAMQNLITDQSLQRPELRPTSTDPNLTREKLMTCRGFELRRGVEVTGVVKENGRAVGVRYRDANGVESENHAHWVVGDDGVNSRVREACGIELSTKLMPLDFACGGFDWPATLAEAHVRLWMSGECAKSGIFGCGCVPMPGGKGAFLALVRPRVFEEPEKSRADWQAFVDREKVDPNVIAGKRFPEDIIRVRRPWGHAKAYGAPGAFLIGDAAHPVTPAGGQGANMSVADAVCLADLLQTGRQDILSEYERRRRPANDRSISVTRRAVFLMGLPDRLVSLGVSAGLSFLRSRPNIVERGFRFVSRAFLEDERS